jgi:hypothetical protein
MTDQDRYPEHSLCHGLSIRKLLASVGVAAALAALVVLTAAMVRSGTTSSLLPVAGAEPSTSPTSAPTSAPSTVETPQTPLPTGADTKGFTNSSARCAGDAVAIGRTEKSLVVICPGEDGNYQYRGVRLRDGAALTLTAETTDGRQFVARNDGVTYAVSPTQLLVTSGQTVINREPMTVYWAPHFAAEGAPTPQTPSTTTPGSR